MAATVTPEQAAGAALDHMTGPFIWGASDCCAAACAAFRSLHGFSPMDGAPEYATEAEAALILGDDPAETMRRAMLGAGMVAGAEIGGLGIYHGAQPSLALCIDKSRWAVKTMRGVTIMRADLEAYHAA